MNCKYCHPKYENPIELMKIKLPISLCNVKYSLESICDINVLNCKDGESAFLWMGIMGEDAISDSMMKHSKRIDIKYCPFCGRKIGE
jgi:hypothetical protein